MYLRSKNKQLVINIDHITSFYIRKNAMVEKSTTLIEGLDTPIQVTKYYNTLIVELLNRSTESFDEKELTFNKLSDILAKKDQVEGSFIDID